MAPYHNYCVHQPPQGDEVAEPIELSDEETEGEAAQDLKALDTNQERKKAGLPPLELDSLPSTVCTKMLTLL